MQENPIVLVLNCGSSSLKFALITPSNGDNILVGLAEKLGLDDACISWRDSGAKQQKSLGAAAMHDAALSAIVEIIQSRPEWAEQLVAVGHRVVHGGENFTASTLIDDDVLNTIKRVSGLAPLHNPANVTGILAAQNSFPDLPQAAVFDTAFHQSMPTPAFVYALPYKLYREHGVRRYGFHGTSHRYVAARAAEQLEQSLTSCNLITAHLGNGASVCAIKQGKSVDTSTGLTPLEGLVMGTRCGDMDPGIYQYLMQQLALDAEQVNTMLNKESGLLGISELSNDCRELQQAAEQGHTQAQLALSIFIYRLAKYIAAYMVPLQQLDALVFTGGIGENSAFIREQVCQCLRFINIELDQTRNNATAGGKLDRISTSQSLPVYVIPTNEELVIAEDTFALLNHA